MKLAEQVVEFVAKGLEKVLGAIDTLRKSLGSINGKVEVKPIDEMAFATSIVLMQKLVDTTQSWVRAGMAGTTMGNLLQVQIQYLSREIASIFLPVLRAASEAIDRLTRYFRELTGDQQRNIRIWVEAAAAILVVNNLLPRVASLIASVLTPAFAGFGVMATGLGGTFSWAFARASAAMAAFGASAAAATASVNQGLGSTAFQAGVVARTVTSVASIWAGSMNAMLASTERLRLTTQALAISTSGVGNASAATGFSRIWAGLVSLFQSALPAIGAVGGALRVLGGVASSVFAGIGTALSFATAGLSTLLPIILSIGTAFLVGTEGGRRTLQDLAKWAADTAKWVGEAFASLAAYLRPVWSTIRDGFLAVWEYIRPGLETMGGAIARTFRSLSDAFSSLWQAVRPLAEVLWRIAEVVGKTVWQALVGTFSALSGVVSMLSTAFRVLSTLLSPLFGLLSIATAPLTGVLEGIGKIVSWIASGIESLSKSFTATFGDMATLFESVFGPLQDLFGEIARVVSEISSVIVGELFAAVRETASAFGSLFGNWDDFLKNFVAVVRQTVISIRDTVRWMVDSIAGSLNAAIRTMAGMARAVGLESLAQRLERIQIDLARGNRARSEPQEGRPGRERDSLEMAGGGFGSPDQLWRRLQEAAIRMDAVRRDERRNQLLEQIAGNTRGLNSAGWSATGGDWGEEVISQ